MRVTVATRNQGKLRELVPLFAELDLGFDLVTIDALAPAAELREDGLTFEDNALAKARQAAAATGLPALADDSGLEVDLLDGKPGVRSARRVFGALGCRRSLLQPIVDMLGSLREVVDPKQRRNAGEAADQHRRHQKKRGSAEPVERVGCFILRRL